MTGSSFSFRGSLSSESFKSDIEMLLQADLWDTFKEWRAVEQPLSLCLVSGETIVVKLLEYSVRSRSFYCAPIVGGGQKELFVGSHGNRFLVNVDDEWVQFSAQHINTYQFGDRKILEVLKPSGLTRFVSLQSLF